jgi:hypothetical protein
VVEVDRSGRVVRSIAGKKMDIRLGWVTGTQPLPDGGLLVADYTGKRLLEIDASGRVAHAIKTGDWAIASISVTP